MPGSPLRLESRVRAPGRRQAEGIPTRPHVVIVGGGPTGVEMAGALQELIDHVLVKDFPDLDTSASEIVLVEMGDAVESS